MKNSEYWKQRFTQLEAAQNAIGENTKADIERIYREAQRTIEGQITAWYERLMKNNDISMAEAKKWLRGKELREFHWDVGDYIKYAKENAMNQMWMKELENASAKFHISRLEALNISLEQSLQELYLKEEKIVYNTLDDVYKEGYYRTMYEMQKGFSVGFDVAKISNDYVAKVLAKPWAPDKYNFSERIWQSKTKLINTVHDDISKNILLGEDPRKAIDSIVKKLGASRYNAGRLVMTEEAYFSSLAQGECLKDLDVEKYEILATLDSRTSEICQSLDGKTFEMKDYQAGATAPPFHVFCRSTTVPYFDKDYDLKGERIARGKDGKNYTVDADMKYPEWKKVFVDKEMSYKDWQAKSAPKASAPAPKTESKVKTEPKIKKANSIEEAEKFALSNGVRHVDYSDLPLETANLLNEAAMTLPEDIRPAYIASSKNIEKAIGRKLSRSAKDFYGVHLDVMDLRFGEYPNIEYDFEGGQVVGISSSFKKLEKIKDAKLKVDKIYSEKHDGHTWFFNVDGTSTPFHEMGHVYADKKGIPKGFAEDAEKWFKKAQCDMLKDIDEAWAEAWGGYHTQNPDLPDYIAKYIHNATNMPIDKSVEKLI